jgi:hypothetical protein
MDRNTCAARRPAPPEIGDCALLRALDVSANRFPSLPGQ